VAKTILRFDNGNQYDFILIGIACQHKDYRLCHELNAALGIDLIRENDYEIFNEKRMEKISFAFYHYPTIEEDDYYLFANKGRQGLLIPEQKQIDYFLMIRENVRRLDESWLTNRLKNIPIILGIFKTDPEKLKSRENLVF